MMSLFADKDAEIIEAFNSTSRYLDNLLNIDNTYFDGMVKQIYPSELQFNQQIQPILRHRFWIYIWLFQMVLCRLKFMINATILVLML